jgi:hypothetical protein
MKVALELIKVLVKQTFSFHSQWWGIIVFLYPYGGSGGSNRTILYHKTSGISYAAFMPKSERVLMVLNANKK